MKNNRWCCTLEVEGMKKDQGTINVIFFEDFIQGWEWIQEHQTVYNIISYGENIHDGK